LLRKKNSKAEETSAEEVLLSIKNCQGTKLTGQTIDLFQFNKPKRKEEPKITLISLVRPVLQEQLIRINAKELLNRVPRDLLEFLVHLILINYAKCWWWWF
jgi:hypothetical protein